ncbi:hypothetical protein AHF37_05720 [Paragonimus kellicotti]|nr:hypothetical protein AHF37_05720 [Paragonimus kellicotti]
MRWGVPDVSQIDHLGPQICYDEVEHCKAVSLGPPFITLLGQRYGDFEIPFNISLEEMQLISETATNNPQIPEECSEALHTWYALDENCVVPTYQLKPIVEAHLTLDNQLVSEAKKKWQTGEEGLRKLFSLAIPIMIENGKITKEKAKRYACSDPFLIYGYSGSGKTSIIAKVASMARGWLPDLEPQPSVKPSIATQFRRVSRLLNQSLLESKATKNRRGLFRTQELATQSYVNPQDTAMVIVRFLGTSPGTSTLRQTLKYICRQLATSLAGLEEEKTIEIAEDMDPETIRTMDDFQGSFMKFVFGMINNQGFVRYELNNAQLDDQLVSEAKKKWQTGEEGLRKLFSLAIPIMIENGKITKEKAKRYACSVTEHEIINGILNASEHIRRRIPAFIRTVTDLERIQDHPKAHSFLDMLLEPERQIDESRFELINDMRDITLAAVLKESNIRTYEVPWEAIANDGVEITEHEIINGILNASEHIRRRIPAFIRTVTDLERIQDHPKAHKFCMEFENKTISLIDKTIAEMSSFENDDLYVETLQHLNACNVHVKYFHGRDHVIHAQVVNTFYSLLRCYSNMGRWVVIFLDAIDQLDPADGAYNLSWLRSPLPNNVRLIISTLPDVGGILDAFRVMYPEGPAKRKLSGNAGFKEEPVAEEDEDEQSQRENSEKVVSTKHSFEVSALESTMCEKVLESRLNDRNRVLQPFQWRLVRRAFDRCRLTIFVVLVDRVTEQSFARDYIKELLQQCRLIGRNQCAILPRSFCFDSGSGLLHTTFDLGMGLSCLMTNRLILSIPLGGGTLTWYDLSGHPLKSMPHVAANLFSVKSLIRKHKPNPVSVTLIPLKAGSMLQDDSRPAEEIEENIDDNTSEKEEVRLLQLAEVDFFTGRVTELCNLDKEWSAWFSMNNVTMLMGDWIASMIDNCLYLAHWRSHQLIVTNKPTVNRVFWYSDVHQMLGFVIDSGAFVIDTLGHRIAKLPTPQDVSLASLAIMADNTVICCTKQNMLKSEMLIFEPVAELHSELSEPENWTQDGILDLIDLRIWKFRMNRSVAIPHPSGFRMQKMNSHLSYDGQMMACLFQTRRKQATGFGIVWHNKTGHLVELNLPNNGDENEQTEEQMAICKSVIKSQLLADLNLPDELYENYLETLQCNTVDATNKLPEEERSVRRGGFKMSFVPTAVEDLARFHPKPPIPELHLVYNSIRIAALSLDADPNCLTVDLLGRLSKIPVHNRISSANLIKRNTLYTFSGVLSSTRHVSQSRGLVKKNLPTSLKTEQSFARDYIRYTGGYGRDVAVVFSRENDLLLTSGTECLLLVWSTNTGHLLRVVSQGGAEGIICGVAPNNSNKNTCTPAMGSENGSMLVVCHFPDQSALQYGDSPDQSIFVMGKVYHMDALRKPSKEFATMGSMLFSENEAMESSSNQMITATGEPLTFQPAYISTEYITEDALPTMILVSYKKEARFEADSLVLYDLDEDCQTPICCWSTGNVNAKNIHAFFSSEPVDAWRTYNETQLAFIHTTVTHVKVFTVFYNLNRPESLSSVATHVFLDPTYLDLYMPNLYYITTNGPIRNFGLLNSEYCFLVLVRAHSLSNSKLLIDIQISDPEFGLRSLWDSKPQVIDLVPAMKLINTSEAADNEKSPVARNHEPTEAEEMLELLGYLEATGLCEFLSSLLTYFDAWARCRNYTVSISYSACLSVNTSLRGPL